MTRVAAGLIFNAEGKILITQRSPGKSYPLQWEFPGGKIETGETPEEALIREIKEELSAEITNLYYFDRTIFHYPELSVELHFIQAKLVSEKIVLNEHHHAEWVSVSALKDYEFLAADLEIIGKIMKKHSEN